MVTVPKTVTQAAPSADPGELDLDRSFLHGLAWTGAAKWGVQVVSWAATLITARLLAPTDYGLFGMALVYLGLVSMLSEFGLGSAVVYLREMSSRQLAELNGLALLFGVGAYGLTVLAAWPLGIFFKSPQLPGALLVLGLTSILTALQVVPNGRLQRDMRFRRLSFIDGVQGVVQAGVTIGLALLGWSYWSLVLGGVLAQLTTTILLLVESREKWAWPTKEGLSGALGFSRNVLVARLCWYAYTNADQLIVGRILGQAALGAYAFALALAEAPIDKVTALVGRVLPTYLAAQKDDLGAVRRYVLFVTRGVSLLTFPAALGLAAVAPEFVRVALGAHWASSVVPIQLIACLATIRSVVPLSTHALIARGHTDVVMRNGILTAIILPLGFLVGAQWGIAGVAAAWMIGYLGVSLPLCLRTFREIELSVRSYFGALRPAVLGSTVMLAVVVAARRIMPDGWPVTLRLATEVIAGAAAYCAVILPLSGRQLVALVRTLRGGAVLVPETDPA